MALGAVTLVLSWRHKPKDLSLNDVLIAEIAPAMLDKLRRDGQSKGSLIGTGLLLIWILLGRQLSDERRFNPNFPDIPIMIVTSVVVLAGIFLLPRYLAKRNISSEVTFRRANGKWRWER